MFLLASCSLLVSAPGLRVRDCDHYDHDEVAGAIDFFIERYQGSQENRNFLRSRANNLDIECSDWIGGDKEKNRIISGQTLDSNSIVILDELDDDKWPLGNTALFHELLHWAFWNLERDPDPDHAAGDGPWTSAHDKWIGELKRDYREMTNG